MGPWVIITGNRYKSWFWHPDNAFAYGPILRQFEDLVENVQIPRAELVRQSLSFETETDTEVVLRLLTRVPRPAHRGGIALRLM